MSTVSVLLCTYNSESYLKPLLSSILNSDMPDFSLIIRDDCSKDSTADIVKACGDERVSFSVNERPSGGAAQNFMGALLGCRQGDYIMFSDADDVWDVHKISRTLTTMKAAEEKYGKDTPILVHGDLEVVDENLALISPSLWKHERISPERTDFKQLLCQNNVTGCTVMINRALADLTPEMPKNFVMHDWWLALLASAFGKIVLLDEALIKYRQHGDNSVGAYDASSLTQSAKRLFNRQRVQKIYTSMFRQAGCFGETYGDKLTEEQLALCRAYADMENKGHFGRVLSLIKYGFWKNTLLRNIGQIISI